MIDRAELGSTLADDPQGASQYALAPLATELANSDTDIVTTKPEINDELQFTPKQYEAKLTQWVNTLQPDCVHPLDVGYEFKEGQYIVSLYPIFKAMLAG